MKDYAVGVFKFNIKLFIIRESSSCANVASQVGLHIMATDRTCLWVCVFGRLVGIYKKIEII